MISFKQFIMENIDYVNSGTGHEFPVASEDRNAMNAINKLIISNIDINLEYKFRTIWDGKREKFYTWAAYDAIHITVTKGLKISPNFQVYYLVDTNKKKVSILTHRENYPKKEQEKYFKGFKIN